MADESGARAPIPANTFIVIGVVAVLVGRLLLAMGAISGVGAWVGASLALTLVAAASLWAVSRRR